MNPFLLEALQSYSARSKRPIFLVGGAPRDLLLGIPCHDWDLALQGARPAAQALARRLKGKFIVLNDENRIYRVVWRPAADAPPLTIDFAEIQGKSIEEDLSRRDFTINAMALPVSEWGSVFLKRSLIDPWKGRQDLRRKILRAVSRKAFEADPLRLLRAFRFAAQFDLRVEPRTSRWIKDSCKGMRESYLGVAPERVREELLRLFSQRSSGAVLRNMDRHGLLLNLFPEMEPCRRTAVRFYGAGGVLKHCLNTVTNLDWMFEKILQNMGSSKAYRKGLFKDPDVLRAIQEYLEGSIGGFRRLAWLKLAGFLHDSGKPATAQMQGGRLRFFGHEDVGARMAKQILEGLRASRLEVQTVRGWVQNHMRPGNLAAAPKITDKAIARFFRDLGPEGVGMLLVSLGDHYNYLGRSRWGKRTDSVERLCVSLWNSYFKRQAVVQPVRLVDGHVLIGRLHLKPGPLIGILLDDIRDAQVEGKLRAAEEAVAWARKRLPMLRREAARSLPRRGPSRRA